MVCKKFLSFLTLLFLSASIFAAEVTLQNGLNGYNGCTDTHLRTQGFTPPHNFWYDNFANDSLNVTAN